MNFTKASLVMRGLYSSVEYIWTLILVECEAKVYIIIVLQMFLILLYP